jgi:pectate lyase
MFSKTAVFFQCILFVIMAHNASAKLLAFPTAQGFGANATGGRGGTVVHVTTLSETGAGSLADACSQSNRTVVFDVGGVINIKTRINVADNVTLAGQTAPGDGIVIYGFGIITNGHDIIVRYLSILGSLANMDQDKCAVTWDGSKNVIYDHCTIGWGRWDCMHVTQDSLITLQYCIIGEGIDPQRFGAITDGTRNWTVHHNLWIDQKSRNPKMKCFLQYINNVIYNWGCCGIVGGHSAAVNYQDVINNYFIAGPSSSADYLSDWTATDNAYSSGNYVDMNKDGVLNGIPVTTADFSSAGATVRTTPYLTAPVPVIVETAASAYATVMNKAGSSLHRLTMDNRLISQLKSLGKEGANIADESVVGGVGTVKSGTPLADADQDGIPDEWEKAHGLNPNSAADRNATNLSPDGYTNLEVYLNELAGDGAVAVSRDNQQPALKDAEARKALTARLSVRSLLITTAFAMNARLEFLDASGQALRPARCVRLTAGENAVKFDKSNTVRLSSRVLFMQLSGEKGLRYIIKCPDRMLF